MRRLWEGLALNCAHSLRLELRLAPRGAVAALVLLLLVAVDALEASGLQALGCDNKISRARSSRLRSSSSFSLLLLLRVPSSSISIAHHSRGCRRASARRGAGPGPPHPRIALGTSGARPRGLGSSVAAAGAFPRDGLGRRGSSACLLCPRALLYLLRTSSTLPRSVVILAVSRAVQLCTFSSNAATSSNRASVSSSPSDSTHKRPCRGGCSCAYSSSAIVLVWAALGAHAARRGRPEAVLLGVCSSRAATR